MIVIPMTLSQNQYQVKYWTMRGNVPVEGYDSLIWTERFQPAGEFELVTGKVDATRALLPLGSYLSLTDSREIMVVETHSISADNDGSRKLTVKGRTLWSLLENRITAPTGATNNAILILSPVPSTVDVINVISRNIINANEGDVTEIWDMTTKALPTRARQVPRGQAYAEILKLLQEDDLGVRTSRNDEINYSTGAGLEVYNGNDRRDTIIFDVRRGDFEDGQYLWSNVGYKTSVYVSATNGGREVVAAGTSGYTNFARRVDLLDASDITTAAGATLNSLLDARGRAYLGQHKMTAMFEGKLSANIPYRYGQEDIYGGDYYLGDKVKIIGEYGVNQDMVITEYVRIEDAQGERAYPTLGTPDSI